MSDTAQQSARWTPVGGGADLLPALVRRALVRPLPASSPDDARERDGVRAPAGSSDRLRSARGASLSATGWQRIGLVAVLLLTGFLNLYRLDREGNGNQYYAATVFSMLQSWHNFFFASFDPGGFVTVDKPPLGFWIQAASAKLLGFSGLSLLLPEALAGVASVALLYVLVRRAFGPQAGLLAGLALAVTPVSVAVSRNNTIDSVLVLTLLLATWTAFRAAETGRLGWLLLTAATMGLGFEIKMLQAYLVVPALFLVYLVAAPRRLPVRIGHLALASVVLLVVSFAWPVAVDLTPESERPYVGSTQNNSAVSLAFGYNGLERLVGRGGSLGGLLSGDIGANDGRYGRGQQAAAADGANAQPDGAAVSADGAGAASDGGPVAGPAGPAFGPGGPAGGGPGGIGENGTPGPLRLFNQQLAPQASWLLPLALVGMAVSGWSAWRHRRTLPRNRRAQAFFVWGTWLLTAGAFFSIAGYYHSYYLVMLGPPVAALAAIGLHGAWVAYGHSWRLGWLLPAALVATGGVQASMLATYPEWAPRLVPVALGGTVLAAIVLLAVRALGRRELAAGRWQHVAGLAAALGMLALLVAPSIWAGYPAVGAQTVGGLPSAGPRVMRGPFGGPGGPDDGQVGGPGGPPQFDGRARDDGGSGFGKGGQGFGPGGPGFGPGGPGGSARAEEIAFLEANQGDATFLAATTNANAAAPLILNTGEPVMAMGGFLGSDPILTVDELAAKIRAGEVRFFLLDGRGGPGGPGGPNGSGLVSWVHSTCTAVPSSALGTDQDGSDQSVTGSGVYDCAGLQGAA